MFEFSLSSDPRLTVLAIAIAGTLLIISPSAQAGYKVTLQQVGPDVGPTGSGPIDLSGLGLSFSGPLNSAIKAHVAPIITGGNSFRAD